MKKTISILILLAGSFYSVLLAQGTCEPYPCIGCSPNPDPASTCEGCNQFGPDDIPGSVDPNEMIPPQSVGPEGWVRKDQLLDYMVTFENDPDSATAAAQRVEIRVPISPNLDLPSFRVSDFGFGSFYISVPLGVSEYRDTVLSGPSVGVHVAFEAGLDLENGEAYWTFVSLDTTTMAPTTDPYAGFLPVNNPEIHDGEGFILFTILPHPAAVTFDKIDMYADIIFDLNPPLRTPMVLNTIDADPPESQVDTVFFNHDSLLYQINLSGSDTGSGLANYTVYVSTDGGDFVPYFKSVDSTTVFTRIVPHHTYRFVSVAVDSVGNREPEEGEVEFAFYAYDPVLDIPLRQGWNLTSSYFYPVQPDILDLTDPYYDTVVILKDYTGNIAVPSLALNGVGEWEITKGYQVKVTEDMTLKMPGAPASNQDNPLYLDAGWQIIPYLKQYPDSILYELALVLSDVLIVKDNDGNVLFPEFEIDDIVLMEPFQAYWVKMAQSSKLYYADNYPGRPHPRIEKEKAAPERFDLNGLNTGNNATLILPISAVKDAIDLGDEIGIFNPDGVLCGAGVFTGQNLAIAIWGDDSSTAGSVEGMAAGEPFEMRIWQKTTGEVRMATFSLREGEPVYSPNAIYVAEHIGLGTTSTELRRPDIQFTYYPNPTNGHVHFTLSLVNMTEVQLSIHSLDGKFARQLIHATYGKGLHEFREDLSSLPEGLYVIRVVSGGATMAYKLVLGR